MNDLQGVVALSPEFAGEVKWLLVCSSVGSGLFALSRWDLRAFNIGAFEWPPLAIGTKCSRRCFRTLSSGVAEDSRRAISAFKS